MFCNFFKYFLGSKFSSRGKKDIAWLLWSFTLNTNYFIIMLNCLLIRGSFQWTNFLGCVCLQESTWGIDQSNCGKVLGRIAASRLYGKRTRKRNDWDWSDPSFVYPQTVFCIYRPLFVVRWRVNGLRLGVNVLRWRVNVLEDWSLYRPTQRRLHQDAHTCITHFMACLECCVVGTADASCHFWCVALKMMTVSVALSLPLNGEVKRVSLKCLFKWLVGCTKLKHQ